MNRKQKIEEIQRDFERALTSADSLEQIKTLRVDYLGRKAGRLNDILRSLKELPEQERKVIGPLATAARQEMEAHLSGKESTLAAHSMHATDVTLPGIPPQHGHLHPLTQVQNELMDIFISMGFMVHEGPELENDFYNFEALNFPPSHPARDMQDTFFIKTPITRKERHSMDNSKWLMRTHTSNMQVRLMEQNTPPLRCIIPGRVFRNEATDASHEHTFYQLEGIVVDTNITVGNLIWFLQEMFRQLYKKDVKVRLRPGYFPFTEPSYETDLSCTFCDQQGCRVCKHTGWIEMGGSGMIHPNVFKAAGYPAGKYTGFAFGMGPNRLAMLKYGIPDIRYFMQNDIRFLHQF
jgi:phenylalanyl-tRNA synthetase alpha chain